MDRRNRTSGTRPRRWRAALVILAVVATGAAACRPKAGDPLNNPSVEEDGNNDGMADCFRFEGWGNNAASIGRVAGGHTGAWSERVTITSYGDGERLMVPTLDDDCSPMTAPGARYTASLWYRSTAPVSMAVYAQRATGWSLWFRGGAEPASGSFRLAAVDLPPIPEGVTGVSFGMSLRSVGEVVTDDYGLIFSDPATPAPAQPNGCPAGYAALTFDDGPAATTPLLLDALAGKGAKATFFVIGQQIAANAGVVLREANEGHVVADHSWSHPELPTLTDDQIRSELTMTADAIVKAGARRPGLFRPPYGATDTRVNGIGIALNLYPTLWNIDTNDWTGISVDETVNRALGPMRAGSVVLFHDRMANSVAAVPAIVDGMRQRGLCSGVMYQSWVFQPSTGSYAVVGAP